MHDNIKRHRVESHTEDKIYTGECPFCKDKTNPNLFELSIYNEKKDHEYIAWEYKFTCKDCDTGFVVTDFAFGVANKLHERLKIKDAPRKDFLGY